MFAFRFKTEVFVLADQHEIRCTRRYSAFILAVNLKLELNFHNFSLILVLPTAISCYRCHSEDGSTSCFLGKCFYSVAYHNCDGKRMVRTQGCAYFSCFFTKVLNRSVVGKSTVSVLAKWLHVDKYTEQIAHLPILLLQQ